MGNIYRSINYLAFGFLFCVLSLNLNIGTFVINITPAWIGYILLFLGLNEVTIRKYGWLKYLALFLGAADLILWIIEIMPLAIDLRYADIGLGLLHVIFVYFLLGAVIEMARLQRSIYVEAFRTVRIINVVAYLLTLALAILVMVDEFFAFSVLVSGIIAVLAYVLTCFYLFRFKKELKDREEII